jgi:hypothetical protein
MNENIIIGILKRDITLNIVTLMICLSYLYIYFLLDLTLKHDEDYKRIYYLSDSSNRSLNDFIADSEELKYITFQEFPNMIIN